MTRIMGAIVGPKRDIKARLNTPRIADSHMQLRRRELLHAAAIAALAGCSERNKTPTERTPITRSPTETTTVTHGYGGHATTTATLTETAVSSTATETRQATATDTQTERPNPVAGQPPTSTETATSTPHKSETVGDGSDSRNDDLAAQRSAYGYSSYGGYKP